MFVRTIKDQDGYRLAPVGYGLTDMIAAVNMLTMHELNGHFATPELARVTAEANGLNFVMVH
jgi:hypothetical protein